MKKRLFKARKGAQISKTKAQIYGEYLYSLSDERKGRLSPGFVVKKAKNLNAPIHDFFIWDDEKAAKAYRIWQARSLLGAIIIEYEYDGKHGETRAFLNVDTDDFYGGKNSSKNIYVTIEEITQNEIFIEQVINNALMEAKSWNSKYKQYSDFREFEKLKTVFEVIEKL